MQLITFHDETGALLQVDVGQLYATFGRVPDYRQARGKRYSLAYLLTVICLAKLAGEHKPAAIAEWIQLRGSLLAGGVWRRPALGAVAETPLGAIAVYTAHLSLRPWRNRQGVGRLRAWVEATAGARPSLIGGDFNAGDGAPHIVALGAAQGGGPGWVDAFRAVQPTADGTTHTFRLFGHAVARQRLDYLFLRPGTPQLRIEICEPTTSPGAPFSDHLAIVARFAAEG